ncbi:MAG: 16S rRNA processing protein RimM [Candidatus Omnitrophica bacterium]|nr:16S rRNA processing protein RimM [Candidatus Omnitrophota bacterium]
MRINPPDPWVLIGKIGKAHGLDGSVRVWPEADLGEIFDNQVPLKLWFPSKEPGMDLAPLSVQETSEAWLVRWEGVTDREAARSLCNAWIVALREDLPEPEEDRAYWDDLIGARVETKEGENIGVVIEIHEGPAQDALEIERENGGRFLLPLSEEVDADLERSRVEGEPNRLKVNMPDGIIQATSLEPLDRPRKRVRREQARERVKNRQRDE